MAKRRDVEPALLLASRFDTSAASLAEKCLPSQLVPSHAPCSKQTGDGQSISLQAWSMRSGSLAQDSSLPMVVSQQQKKLLQQNSMIVCECSCTCGIAQKSWQMSGVLVVMRLSCLLEAACSLVLPRTRPALATQARRHCETPLSLFLLRGPSGSMCGRPVT